MARLLPLERFAPIFEPLADYRIGMVDGVGNPGDRLLDSAARQLMQAFGLKWKTINALADPPNQYADVDVVLLFGGGSGGGPPYCMEIRRRAVESGKPCIMLPQSFHAPEDCRRYVRVYLRESVSRNFCSDGIIAPDLALGYDFPDVAPPHLGEGVFLRHGGHAAFGDRAHDDPCDWCYTAEEYIALAAQYEHIVTDRLHLAVTALGIGRQATLLPVSYHKNRAMWEEWLRDMGCHWSESP